MGDEGRRRTRRRVSSGRVEQVADCLSLEPENEDDEDYMLALALSLSTSTHKENSSSQPGKTTAVGDSEEHNEESISRQVQEDSTRDDAAMRESPELISPTSSEATAVSDALEGEREEGTLVAPHSSSQREGCSHLSLSVTADGENVGTAAAEREDGGDDDDDNGDNDGDDDKEYADRVGLPLHPKRRKVESPDFTVSASLPSSSTTLMYKGQERDIGPTNGAYNVDDKSDGRERRVRKSRRSTSSSGGSDETVDDDEDDDDAQLAMAMSLSLAEAEGKIVVSDDTAAAAASPEDDGRRGMLAARTAEAGDAIKMGEKVAAVGRGRLLKRRKGELRGRHSRNNVEEDDDEEGEEWRVDEDEEEESESCSDAATSLMNPSDVEEIEGDGAGGTKFAKCENESGERRDRNLTGSLKTTAAAAGRMMKTAEGGVTDDNDRDGGKRHKGSAASRKSEDIANEWGETDIEVRPQWKPPSSARQRMRSEGPPVDDNINEDEGSGKPGRRRGIRQGVTDAESKVALKEARQWLWNRLATEEEVNNGGREKGRRLGRGSDDRECSRPRRYVTYTTLQNVMRMAKIPVGQHELVAMLKCFEESEVASGAASSGGAIVPAVSGAAEAWRLLERQKELETSRGKAPRRQGTTDGRKEAVLMGFDEQRTMEERETSEEDARATRLSWKGFCRMFDHAKLRSTIKGKVW